MMEQLRHRILVLSDLHFYNPQFYETKILKGTPLRDPPSRLPTDLALGDARVNPFQALLKLVREGRISCDAIAACGDLTTCSDPTAINLGWLQLNRLSTELGNKPLLTTAGNHDIDSRFQTSRTAPERMLRYLDPPFPVPEPAAIASYWANGYCIIDRFDDVRYVLVNSCSLHGYKTQDEIQSDHGFVAEELLRKLEDDIRLRGSKQLNVLICHHHPIEVDDAPGSYGTITNGLALISSLERLSPPRWLILHGHRHLPSVRYASGSPVSPVVFAVGSFSANLHLDIQAKTANQFYIVDLVCGDGLWGGTYQAWTWSNEGWIERQSTAALAPLGGFGYRGDATSVAAQIAPLVPPRSDGTVRWERLESTLPFLAYMSVEDKKTVLTILAAQHGIECETDSMRIGPESYMWRLGRRL